ncbi:MAG: hypothetical protein AB9835_14470 [Eubacteriales bacterium]
MKARIPISAADRDTISKAAVEHNKQYRILITQRLIYAAMLAVAIAFGIGPKRMPRFKQTLLQLFTEATDLYDDCMETGLERACRERGIDTEL